MTATAKLTIVKAIHTGIWIFFNIVIFYLLYAVIYDTIDVWFWIGIGLFILEAIILLLFKMTCPLTLIARRYSSSTKDNFDIYLPNWLAKYTKQIYTAILMMIIFMACYRMLL